MKLTAKKICSIINGEIKGDPAVIVSSFSDINNAKNGKYENFTFSDDTGVYEALIELDAPVKIGDIIGQVHFPQKPELDPITYKSKTEGILIGRTHKALVYPGDFLALVAQEIK